LPQAMLLVKVTDCSPIAELIALCGRVRVGSQSCVCVPRESHLLGTFYRNTVVASVVPARRGDKELSDLLESGWLVEREVDQLVQRPKGKRK
jgi:hypothetical protein